MKRISIFLITVALIAGMVGCDGNGSDPYADYIKIYNWTDLDNIKNNLVVKYVLMNDLDSTAAGYEELASPTANNGTGWQPIGGTYDHPFKGIFDGQGHEIRDLSINRPDEDHVGLFGCTWTGSIIKYVGVVNIIVTGNDSVGGLVGFSYEGTVSNCHAIGSVTGSWYYVGGLVGANAGNVSDSYSSTDVTGAEWFVGGLIGANGGTVSNSYSTGNVTSMKYEVGGLVGRNDGTVSNSYSSGSVTGDSGVGGLVGLNHDGTVSNCHATGNVAGNSSVGGLVGLNLAIVSNSFWDTETSGQLASDGGTGKTTEEMQDIDTFSGIWNIIGVDNPNDRDAGYIWNIVDDETYPFLSWEPVS